MSVENVLSFVKELGEKEPEVLRGLLDAGPEEVLAAAQNRGVNASLDDVKQAGAALHTAANQTNSTGTDGELDEGALESVTGGVAPALVIGAIGATASVLSATHTISDGKVTGYVADGLSEAGKAVGNFFKSW